MPAESVAAFREREREREREGERGQISKYLQTDFSHHRGSSRWRNCAYRDERCKTVPLVPEICPRVSPRGAISFENRLLLRANGGAGGTSGGIPRRRWSVRGRKSTVARAGVGKGRRGGCSRLHNCTVHSANVSILSINPWYKSNLSSGRRGAAAGSRGA